MNAVRIHACVGLPLRRSAMILTGRSPGGSTYRLLTRLAVLLATVWLGLLMAGTARAGCVDNPAMLKQSWQDDVTAGGFMTISNDLRDATSIVGFWRVVFTSQGSTGIPDGTIVDHALAQWHADGTEIMNSNKPPLTSNFCLGVWEKTGDNTYALNHYAIGWDSTGANPLGLANIREVVSLTNNGLCFEGTFSIDQYDTNNNLIGHVVGTLTGQRIKITTNVGDLI